MSETTRNAFWWTNYPNIRLRNIGESTDDVISVINLRPPPVGRSLRPVAQVVRVPVKIIYSVS
jgi:hypothetical protein